MKCAICGEERPLVYASIYLQNGACYDCYRQGKLVHDHMSKVLTIRFDENNNCIVEHRDAFNQVWATKEFKTKRYLQYVKKYTSKLMGTIVE